MLDGSHDVGLLLDEGVYQLLRPIQIVVHVFQHGWKCVMILTLMSHGWLLSAASI